MKNYGKPDIELTSTGQLLQTAPREKKIQSAEAEELKVHVLWQSHQRKQEGYSLLI